MPFSVWIFLRLLVPTGPILIQYLLYSFDLYTPPFPQPAYILLVFSLSLATLTEYQNTTGVIYGSIIPAIGASILYTIYILTINEPNKHTKVLLIGFYMWAVLIIVNI